MYPENRRLKKYLVSLNIIAALLNKRKLSDILTIPILELPDDWEIVDAFYSSDHRQLWLIIHSKSFDSIPPQNEIPLLNNWLEDNQKVITITSDQYCPNCFYYTTPEMFGTVNEILCPNCYTKLYLIIINDGRRVFSLIPDKASMTTKEFNEWNKYFPTIEKDDYK